MNKFTTLLLLVGVLGFGLVGCSGADGDLGSKGGEAGSKTSPEEEIKRIQADPNMPQGAKDAAIGQIQARIDAGKAMGESMKANKNKPE